MLLFVKYHMHLVLIRYIAGSITFRCLRFYSGAGGGGQNQRYFGKTFQPWRIQNKQRWELAIPYMECDTDKKCSCSLGNIATEASKRPKKVNRLSPRFTLISSQKKENNNNKKHQGIKTWKVMNLILKPTIKILFSVLLSFEQSIPQCKS